jgi:hypothetical protein
MSTTAQELESFTEFAKKHLGGRDPGPSLEELFDLWRLENPTESDYAENLAALSGAIQDFKNGDRGRPAGEVSHELRGELGISEE